MNGRGGSVKSLGALFRQFLSGVSKSMSIDWSGFIESHLTGIAIEDSHRLIRVYLRDTTHQRSIITISGVDRFVVNEMRETNIVECISCWGALSSDSDYREPLVWLMTGKQDGDSNGAFAPLLDKTKDSIRKGEKVLLEIEPVFGAQLIALATEVSIEKVQ